MSRFMSLLNALGLHDRFLANLKENILLDDINWNNVKRPFYKERITAGNFLDRLL